MFSIRFHQKNLPFFPPCLLKFFFQKFSSRFLYSKKMYYIIFFNLESSSRPIPDIFYFLWEVFLIDFLSKMEPQKAWNSFGTILNWWNFGLHWIKFCILPCCVCHILEVFSDKSCLYFLFHANFIFPPTLSYLWNMQLSTNLDIWKCVWVHDSYQ